MRRLPYLFSYIIFIIVGGVTSQFQLQDTAVIFMFLVVAGFCLDFARWRNIGRPDWQFGLLMTIMLWPLIGSMMFDNPTDATMLGFGVCVAVTLAMRVYLFVWKGADVQQEVRKPEVLDKYAGQAEQWK